MHLCVVHFTVPHVYIYIDFCSNHVASAQAYWIWNAFGCHINNIKWDSNCVCLVYA